MRQFLEVVFRDRQAISRLFMESKTGLIDEAVRSRGLECLYGDMRLFVKIFTARISVLRLSPKDGSINSDVLVRRIRPTFQGRRHDNIKHLIPFIIA